MHACAWCMHVHSLHTRRWTPRLRLWGGHESRCVPESPQGRCGAEWGTECMHRMQAEFVSFWEAHAAAPLAARDVLLRSACPQLCGMYMVKLAMLCTLVGGVAHADPSGLKVRAPPSPLPPPACAPFPLSHLLRAPPFPSPASRVPPSSPTTPLSRHLPSPATPLVTATRPRLRSRCAASRTCCWSVTRVPASRRRAAGSHQGGRSS